MKFGIFLIFCLLTACSYAQHINYLITRAEEKALKASPYNSSKSFQLSHLRENQNSFRRSNYPKSIRSILDNMSLDDTLWIVETFDEVCSNCPSFEYNILFKDSAYYFNTLINNRSVKSSFFDKNIKYPHSIFLQIVDSVRQKRNWLLNPLKYGSDGCADGDHTFITIIYPDLKIESLYIRCWERKL